MQSENVTTKKNSNAKKLKFTTKLQPLRKDQKLKDKN